jgi:hypothetical protein
MLNKPNKLGFLLGLSLQYFLRDELPVRGIYNGIDGYTDLEEQA